MGNMTGSGLGVVRRLSFAGGAQSQPGQPYLVYRPVEEKSRAALIVATQLQPAVKCLIFLSDLPESLDGRFSYSRHVF